MDTEDTATKRRPTLLQRILIGGNVRWTMVRLLVLLTVTTFVLNYFFPEGEARYRRILVDGKSMDPTYVHGETLLMHALEYSDQTPQRGDVVVLGQEGHSPFYLKRIIGLPGERVAIRRGQMTIDGTVYDAYGDGRIRALWSISGDGIDPAWLRAALDTVPLAIRSTPWADPERDGRGIALPSASWVEKDGTLTGADRLISRQRRLFPLPGEAKPDWWIVTQVARAMGWQAAFHYEWAAEIYREHVRLTAYGNDGARLLNLRRHAPISNPAYEELTPWRWGELPFDEGRFPTPDGKARLLPLS